MPSFRQANEKKPCSLGFFFVYIHRPVLLLLCLDDAEPELRPITEPNRKKKKTVEERCFTQHGMKNRSTKISFTPSSTQPWRGFRAFRKRTLFSGSSFFSGSGRPSRLLNENKGTVISQAEPGEHIPTDLASCSSA